ncbi:unnamed protein product [Durusdinium trenchii]
MAVDFVSSSRRLIAWAEDMPQGFIGLSFVMTHMHKVHRPFGFAALSAGLSFLKGFLIPTGQGFMLSYKLAKARQETRDLKQFAEIFARNHKLDQIRGAVNVLLAKETDNNQKEDDAIQLIKENFVEVELHLREKLRMPKNKTKSLYQEVDKLLEEYGSGASMYSQGAVNERFLQDLRQELASLD